MRMTENEAISVLKMIEAHGIITNQAKETAIKALEEIQQYRSIGTVEECQTAVEKMNKNREKLLFIINTYGSRPQQDMAIEELSELQKAILKYRRFPNKETERDIIDEIADVSIMLEQLKIIYSCSKKVEERIDYKIDRQIQRIMNIYHD